MPSGTPAVAPPLDLSSAIAHRHSVYALSPSLPQGVTDTLIHDILKDTVLNIPSAFNSQTTRLILVVKDEHRKFWSSVAETFQKAMDEETFAKVSGRLAGFKGAYGTVLFYEDNAVVESMQQKQQRYAEQFPQWSEHTSGMHQLYVWTALSAYKGIGCNLQHYNYDPKVQEMALALFGLPSSWSLKSQLVFGETDPEKYPGTKEKLDTAETVKVFGV